MKLRRRQILNTVTVISSAICVLSLGGCFVGALHPLTLWYTTPEGVAYSVGYADSRGFTVGKVWPIRRPVPGWLAGNYPLAVYQPLRGENDDVADESFFGVTVEGERQYGTSDGTALPPYVISARGVIVPHVLLLAVALPLPGLWFARWIRWRQGTPPGLCASCGYDLRATPDRCPECGTMSSIGKRRQSE